MGIILLNIVYTGFNSTKGIKSEFINVVAKSAIVNNMNGMNTSQNPLLLIFFINCNTPLFLFLFCFFILCYNPSNISGQNIFASVYNANNITMINTTGFMLTKLGGGIVFAP